MKKRNKFLAGLTAVTIALSSFGMMCANAISGEELITNGSFESANTDISVPITEFGNTAATANVAYSTTVGYNDNSSIHITGGNEKVTTPTNLGLTKGGTYNISFMIKGTLTSTNGMYIRMGWDWNANQAKLTGNADGEFSVVAGNNILKATAVSDGWYKVESTTPWTCSDMEIAFFNVQSWTQNNDGIVDFYIDDLKITGVSKFDAKGSVISQFGNTSAISGLEYSNVDAYEGNNSIHIKNRGEMTTPTKLRLAKNNTYNISFMIKGKLTTSNGMYIRMGWNWNANQAKLKSDTNGVFSIQSGAGDGIMKATKVSDGWYKVESITPWTCGEMNIGFFNVQSSGGTIDFYIDNLSITDSETGAEMITDGGFETAVIETEMIANGSFGGHVIPDTNGAVVTELGNTSAISGLEYSTADAYDGNRSIHITSGGEMTTPTKLRLTQGSKYNFSFYIKGKLTSDNGMYIRMGWGYAANAAKLKSDASGAFSVQTGAGDGILKVTADKDGWYKVESSTPWTCAEMNIGFFNVTSAGGAVDFYIDKLSITEEIPNEVIGSFAMSGETADKTVTINVTNNGHADGYGAILILATYKDDVMQNIAMNDDATVVEMGKTETLTQTITVNDGETLTAFLWDGLNGMNPLTECDDLITVTVE